GFARPHRKDLAADPRQLEVMETPMYRRQLVVADLQTSGLADPGEYALHNPADLAQAAPVRRPLLCQVVFDSPLFEALVIPRRAVRRVHDSITPSLKYGNRSADFPWTSVYSRNRRSTKWHRRHRHSNITLDG